MENNQWFRTYLFIWAGQFVSMISSYSVHFAVIIWISLKHQSAEVLALAGIAGLLPQAIAVGRDVEHVGNHATVSLEAAAMMEGDRGDREAQGAAFPAGGLVHHGQAHLIALEVERAPHRQAQRAAGVVIGVGGAVGGFGLLRLALVVQRHVADSKCFSAGVFGGQGDLASGAVVCGRGNETFEVSTNDGLGVDGFHKGLRSGLGTHNRFTGESRTSREDRCRINKDL